MSRRRTIDVVGTEDLVDDTALGILSHALIQLNQDITTHIGSIVGRTSGTAVGSIRNLTACQGYRRITTHVGHIAAAIELVADGSAQHLDIGVVLHHTSLTAAKDIALDIGSSIDGDIRKDGSREVVAQIDITTATAIHVTTIFRCYVGSISDLAT
jgi:hypothetical protein